MVKGSLLFVYGILKDILGNEEGAEYVADHTIEEGYKMYNLGMFPGVIKGEGSVSGKVFRVTDELLAQCDRIEGTPHLYVRDTIETPDGEASIYLFNQKVNDYHAEVDGGVW